MDVKHFLNTAKSFEEIVDKIADLAGDGSEATKTDLMSFLLVKDNHTFDKFSIPKLACRALLVRGPEGVRAISSLISKSEGRIYPAAMVESLWYAAHGELDPVTHMRGGLNLPGVLNTKPAQETVAAAHTAFRDFVAGAQHDEEFFEILLQFMNGYQLKSLIGSLPAEMMRTEVFRIISESSIKITENLLDEYEDLLGKQLNEEEYQRFLTQHPVLLDPLANRVIPKQRLGLEFITDYVVEKIDNQYFAVEIEKPQDSLFTKAGDFSAGFTHAYGQVIDFLEWVDTHAEYARHHMPGISSPRGMLVMGMRASLTQTQAAKLKRFAIISPNIEILAFDDLLRKARVLYNNIHKRNMPV